MMFSFGNRTVEHISGNTYGANAGLDTPAVDLMIGYEKFMNSPDGGGVYNFTITGGFEASAGAVVGGEVTNNHTVRRPFDFFRKNQ